ncbi:MAG: type II toxin-antitoxin system HicB family antitoxin [Thermoplasmata archaeon]|nr:type II toxin-antitoxin system HicB family antitoxin [Thermoplasmata archaeon]
MARYRLSIVVEKDDNGYFAFCPELQGCYTQGDNYEEVIEGIKDAIKLHIEDRVANNEEIPTSEMTSLSTIEMEA